MRKDASVVKWDSRKLQAAEPVQLLPAEEDAPLRCLGTLLRGC